MHTVFGLLSLDGQKRRAHDVAWELDQLAVADALGREREFAAPSRAPPQAVGAAQPGEDLIERCRGDTIKIGTPLKAGSTVEQLGLFGRFGDHLNGLQTMLNIVGATLDVALGMVTLAGE
jgi:hypothetical protein